MIEQVLIIGTLLLLAYIYALYTPVIRFLARGFGRPWSKDSAQRPSMSVILAAYNEEMVMERCLTALLQLDYPSDRLEIIVGSDGSSDQTNSILIDYAASHPQIKVHAFADRRGKIPVVNDLVSRSSGEILFFTDADVSLDPSSLLLHARNYGDPDVGGVAGSLLLCRSEDAQHGPIKSEQYYQSVEDKVRKSEATLHSTVGIFGGNYSIRRSLWREIPNEPIFDELNVALTVVQQGKRMVFEGEAIAREYSARSMKDEFDRRTRFAARGLATLALFGSLMNPVGSWTGFMLWSHRMFRWLSPFFFLLLFVSTLAGTLEHSGWWIPALAALEVLGLLIAFVGGALERRVPSLRIMTHLHWFAMMNIAFAIGTYRFVFKREQKFWSQPTRTQLPERTPDFVAREILDL